MRTIKEMNACGYNHSAIKALNSLDTQDRDLFSYYEEYISGLKYKSGMSIRYDRKASMLEVLKALYKHLNTNPKSESYGECSPSMRTLSATINPELELIKEDDKSSVKKKKEKAMSNTLMYVQRTIKVLRDMGLVIAHEYRAESNQNTERNANFYYELVCVDMLFSDIIEEGNVLIEMAQHVSNTLNNKFDEMLLNIQNNVKASKIFKGYEKFTKNRTMMDFIVFIGRTVKGGLPTPI